MRQTINMSRAPYEPNTLGGGCPMQAPENLAGFVTHAERVNASKVRDRGEKFFDHFSQATLFYNSQTEIEQDHIVRAFCFELGKVETVDIRERILTILTRVDESLAVRVATGLGLEVPLQPHGPLNRSIPADGNPADFQPRPPSRSKVKKSPALSILLSPKEETVLTRKVAILAADGCSNEDLNSMLRALIAGGAAAKIVAPRLGYLTTDTGEIVKIHFSLLTASSVLFDAVYVPGGAESVEGLKTDPASLEFIFEAFKHCKTVGASHDGVELFDILQLTNVKDGGVIVANGNRKKNSFQTDFIKAIAKHRHWNREKQTQPVP